MISVRPLSVVHEADASLASLSASPLSVTSLPLDGSFDAAHEGAQPQSEDSMAEVDSFPEPHPEAESPDCQVPPVSYAREMGYSSDIPFQYPAQPLFNQTVGSASNYPGPLRSFMERRAADRMHDVRIPRSNPIDVPVSLSARSYQSARPHPHFSVPQYATSGVGLPKDASNADYSIDHLHWAANISPAPNHQYAHPYHRLPILEQRRVSAPSVMTVMDRGMGVFDIEL